jgi:hypothetical protein
LLLGELQFHNPSITRFLAHGQEAQTQNALSWSVKLGVCRRADSPSLGVGHLKAS